MGLAKVRADEGRALPTIATDPELDVEVTAEPDLRDEPEEAAPVLGEISEGLQPREKSGATVKKETKKRTRPTRSRTRRARDRRPAAGRVAALPSLSIHGSSRAARTMRRWGSAFALPQKAASRRWSQARQGARRAAKACYIPIEMKVFFQPGKPVELRPEEGDSAEPSAWANGDWRRIVDTQKCYLKAARELLKGPLAGCAPFMPFHLQNDVRLCVFLGTDFVAFRYEAHTPGSTPHKSGAFIMQMPLREAAPLFSDGLIRHADMPPDDSRGFKLGLFLQDPADGHEPIREAEVAIEIFEPKDPWPYLDRPRCIASALNRVELSMYGLAGSPDPAIALGEPFIALTELALPVAWCAIEIFSIENIEAWNRENARRWATEDLNARMVAQHIRRSTLTQLDPKADVRTKFAQVLTDFQALLEGGREEPIQQFLCAHPFLLHATHAKVWPKLKFGDHVSDFVFRDPSGKYLLVEIESPLRPLFRKDGHQTAELTHAIGQIDDWNRYIGDNLQTVRAELGLAEIMPFPEALVVIGRSKTLTDANRQKLRSITASNPRLKILTYDDLISVARSATEHVLGAIHVSGTNLKVYYPARAE